MSAEGWCSLAALAVIVAWGVATHKALRLRRFQVANAFGKLEAELARRYRLIPRLVDAARPVLGQAAATLAAVRQAHDRALAAAAAAREQPMSASAVGMLATAEQTLANALERLRAVAQNHAQLDADGLTQALVGELEWLERRVDRARQAYNRKVLDYNDEASLFPAVMVARLFGFVPAATLLAQPAAAEAASRMVY